MFVFRLHDTESDVIVILAAAVRAVPPVPPPRKTLGDYFAIALAPALIVVLVGSLVFFLAEIFYRGDHGIRLRWTLGWFVLACVLITRIALELGSGKGFLYGFALAGVTTLSMVRYIDPPFAGIVLLGVAWWCVDRLIRDCTLIDDEEDATGEGLLDAAGLGDQPRGRPAGRVRGRLLYQEHATRAAREESLALQPAEADLPGRPAARPPGRWVVWFSLAALPLFGVGQTLLPATDLWRREVAFTCLWFYVLAALGLLLSTSFLGLRRYLRQRWLQMPVSIAFSWLTLGATTAIAVLLLSLLLPRPDAEYSLPALAAKVGSPKAKASRHALLKDAAGEGQGTPGRQADGQQAGAAEGGKASGDPSGLGRNAGVNDQGAMSKDQGASTVDQGAQASSGGGADSPSLPPKPAQISPPDLGRWLKWLVYAAFAVAVLVLLWRYGPALWAGLGELWRDLLGLFGRREASVMAGAAELERRPARPFAAFRNPFNDARLRQRPPAELVGYSFDALQAWAADYGVPRAADETPLEYAARLREALPEIAEAAEGTIFHYTRVAYAGRPPAEDCLATLRQLWAFMGANSAAASRRPR